MVVKHLSAWMLHVLLRSGQRFAENLNVLRRAQANCKIMSVVAATLANGGVCPLTNTEVFTAEVVSRVG